MLYRLDSFTHFFIMISYLNLTDNFLPNFVDLIDSLSSTIYFWFSHNFVHAAKPHKTIFAALPQNKHRAKCVYVAFYWNISSVQSHQRDFLGHVQTEQTQGNLWRQKNKDFLRRRMLSSSQKTTREVPRLDPRVRWRHHGFTPHQLPPPQGMYTRLQRIFFFEISVEFSENFFGSLLQNIFEILFGSEISRNFHVILF